MAWTKEQEQYNRLNHGTKPNLLKLAPLPPILPVPAPLPPLRKTRARRS